jgi:hypothetical protein
MYDALRGRYSVPCPRRGESHVTLSSFRVLERLPGSVHPAVFSIRFACPCGDEHAGLVAHDELDYAPLGLGDGAFLNLMTAHMDSLADELGAVAASRIQAGSWPWSFFCYPEERPRPVFPSSFFLISAGGEEVGLAVRCPACTAVSVNLVSRAHVDVPFHNDSSVGVVEHVFTEDALRVVEEFHADLYSAHFDARRLDLQ